MCDSDPAQRFWRKPRVCDAGLTAGHRPAASRSNSGQPFWVGDKHEVPDMRLVEQYQNGGGGEEGAEGDLRVSSPRDNHEAHANHRADCAAEKESHYDCLPAEQAAYHPHELDIPETHGFLAEHGLAHHAHCVGHACADSYPEGRRGDGESAVGQGERRGYLPVQPEPAQEFHKARKVQRGGCEAEYRREYDTRLVNAVGDYPKVNINKRDYHKGQAEGAGNCKDGPLLGEAEMVGTQAEKKGAQGLNEGIAPRDAGFAVPAAAQKRKIAHKGNVVIPCDGVLAMGAEAVARLVHRKVFARQPVYGDVGEAAQHSTEAGSGYDYEIIHEKTANGQ